MSYEQGYKFGRNVNAHAGITEITKEVRVYKGLTYEASVSAKRQSVIAFRVYEEGLPTDNTSEAISIPIKIWNSLPLATK